MAPQNWPKTVAMAAPATPSFSGKISSQSPKILHTVQTMAAAQPSAPARKKYYFWVEFSPEDIKWFRQAAKERGFRFGSIE